MALLSRDQISDEGASLRGRRGRTLPIMWSILSVLELGFGLSLLFQASMPGVLNLLVGVFAAALAATSGLPAVVDDCGVRPLGRLRRVRWSRVAAVCRPNSYEGSVVIVLDGGRRVETGFPADWLPRLARFHHEGADGRH